MEFRTVEDPVDRARQIQAARAAGECVVDSIKKMMETMMQR